MSILHAVISHLSTDFYDSRCYDPNEKKVIHKKELCLSMQFFNVSLANMSKMQLQQIYVCSVLSIIWISWEVEQLNIISFEHIISISYALNFRRVEPVGDQTIT